MKQLNARIPMYRRESFVEVAHLRRTHGDLSMWTVFVWASYGEWP